MGVWPKKYVGDKLKKMGLQLKVCSNRWDIGIRKWWETGLKQVGTLP